MITNIEVNTKPFNLVKGEVLFAEYKRVELLGEPVEKFHDNGRPYYIVQARVLFDMLDFEAGHGDGFWVGRTIDIFLGDEGCPGYQYDNRPCTLARSMEAHKANLKKYAQWNHYRRKVTESWFGDDY